MRFWSPMDDSARLRKPSIHLIFRPGSPRASSLSNVHAHVRLIMGATTSRCEEAEAEPVEEVRAASDYLRLRV